MNLPLRISEDMRRGLLEWAESKHTNARPCDFRIGSAADPYLLRWFEVRQGVEWLAIDERQRAEITENKQRGRQDEDIGRPDQGNVFVHQFWRSDDDRALHDHPWSWTTIILDGWYIEHLPLDPAVPWGPTRQIQRNAGDVVARPDPSTPHRVELVDYWPVTTLFLTGPKAREWGFWCKERWVHWRTFTSPHDSGEVGRGCE